MDRNCFAEKLVTIPLLADVLSSVQFKVIRWNRADAAGRHRISNQNSEL